MEYSSESNWESNRARPIFDVNANARLRGSSSVRHSNFTPFISLDSLLFLPLSSAYGAESLGIRLVR